MNRALSKAEQIEDGSRYIIDGTDVERLQRMLAKLSQI